MVLLVAVGSGWVGVVEDLFIHLQQLFFF